MVCAPLKWLGSARIEPTLGETHRVQLFLLMQRANVRNVHALSNLRATSILTVAHGAFRPERRAAGRAVWTGAGPHNRDNKKREANKKHQQNCRGKHRMAFSLLLCHCSSFTCNLSLQLRTLLHHSAQRPLN